MWWGAKMCGGGPRRVVGGRDASDVGQDAWWGPEPRQRGARSCEVMQMGAMEDGRHDRGLEGMGWGWECVGWGQNMWVGAGTCGLGPGHV